MNQKNDPPICDECIFTCAHDFCPNFLCGACPHRFECEICEPEDDDICEPEDDDTVNDQFYCSEDCLRLHMETEFHSSDDESKDGEEA